MLVLLLDTIITIDNHLPKLPQHQTELTSKLQELLLLRLFQLSRLLNLLRLLTLLQEMLPTLKQLMILKHMLDWPDNTKLKAKSITDNGLPEATTPTGLKPAIQVMVQERRRPVVPKQQKRMKVMMTIMKRKKQRPSRIN